VKLDVGNATVLRAEFETNNGINEMQSINNKKYN